MFTTSLQHSIESRTMLEYTKHADAINSILAGVSDPALLTEQQLAEVTDHSNGIINMANVAIAKAQAEESVTIKHMILRPILTILLGMLGTGIGGSIVLGALKVGGVIGMGGVGGAVAAVGGLIWIIGSIVQIVGIAKGIIRTVRGVNIRSKINDIRRQLDVVKATKDAKVDNKAEVARLEGLLTELELLVIKAR